MELGILGGVGILGYLINQRNKEQAFEKNNSAPTPNVKINAPVCADSYPLYYPKYVQQQQQMLSGTRRSNLEIPQGQIKTDDAGQNIKERFQNSIAVDEPDDFIPANDPTSDNLLDLKKRPVSDFVHNNMVPFFGPKIKQNMAGTGISAGNYTDGVEVNSGFDYTQPNNTLMATYTGMDDTYMSKRETGPFFSPAEQQTGWVYGMPLFRPDKSQYEQSLNNVRNDLRPIESQQVGPGLSLDPTVPASGGFHDFTRILPNNVSDYLANQLENRVIVGKHFSAALPESYPGVGVSKEMNPNQSRAPGIKKNRPNSFWDQARRPTMTGKVGFQTNVNYIIPDYAADAKPNNSAREQISYGLGTIRERRNDGPQNAYGSESFCVEQDINVGQGPLGSRVPTGDVRSNTWMSMDNNIRSKSDCNSVPVLNAARPDLGQGSILTNWYVNETDRGSVNPTTIEQINCNKQGLGSSFWTYDDDANTTRKETTEFSYAGNVAKGDLGSTFWTYDDTVPVTTKETTEFSYAGNVVKPDLAPKFWTYDDDMPTTRKETTDYAYAGAPAKIRIGNMMSRDQYFGLDVDVES